MRVVRGNGIEMGMVINAGIEIGVVINTRIEMGVVSINGIEMGMVINARIEMGIKSSTRIEVAISTKHYLPKRLNSFNPAFIEFLYGYDQGKAAFCLHRCF
jgi:ACT domain-containing protein